MGKTSAKLPYVNMDKVKLLVKEQGRRLGYFSEKFGKNPAFMSQVASGKDRLSEEQLAFIAEELGVSEAYLLDETEDPTPAAQKEKPVSGADGLLSEDGLDNNEKEILRLLRAVPADRRPEAEKAVKALIAGLQDMQ